MKKRSFTYRVVCNALVVSLMSSVVLAQSGSQGAKGVATAPAPSTAPFDSQMLAYGAVDQITNAVSTAVCAKVGAKANIVIYEPVSFATIQSYRGFLQSVALLTTAYESLVPDSDHLAQFDQEKKARVTKFQKSLSGRLDEVNKAAFTIGAGDLVPAFNQFAAASTVETPNNTTIPLSGIAVNIAHNLMAVKNCEPNVIYPQLFMSVPKTEDESIGADIRELMNLKHEVEQVLIAKAEAKKGNGQASRKQAIQGNESDPKEKNATDDIEVADYKEVNGLFDEFMKNYFTKDPVSGLTGIVPVTQGFGLQHTLKQPSTYILYVEAIAAGGKQRDRKNLLANLFWGDFLSYNGGAVVAFSLIDAQTSKLLLANTLRYQTKNTNLQKPENSSGTRRGDNLSSIHP